MNRAMAHRGPDGRGIHVSGGVGLAHVRLAVVDLETGSQPFLSEDESLALVLNGEIYNHRELREELLRQGHIFRTQSDTEVLLRLYEAMGLSCLDRIHGMFAFALWDRAERRMWLVRDRLGIKPLYYSWDGDVFVFGSEPKAILAFPGRSTEVDERAVDAFFTYGYVPAPLTIYRDMAKLEAGHMLSITEQGITKTQYWDVSFERNGHENGRELVDTLRTALRSAVHGQLGADVPIGSLLSGGLDSTAVLGFMTETVGKGIPAFTATFADTKDEDRDYAHMAAETYGAAWHETEIAPPSTDLLDRIAWHFDEPFADPSAVPTFLVCEAARERVVVCLSGDGGDEVFGGYRRYRENESRRRIRSLIPGSGGTELLRRASRVAPGGKWLPKPMRLRPILLRAAETPVAAYAEEMSICAPSAKPELYRKSFTASLDGYDPISTIEGCFARSARWDSTAQLQYTDFKTYLADGILTKVDRASMAHGLEVRVPLLDHKLVELVVSLPSSWSVSPGAGKRLLKRSLRGTVPAPILARRKRGFTPPLIPWLEGTVGDALTHRVLQGNPFVDRFLNIGRIRNSCSGHHGTPRCGPRLLWSILVLETWGRRFQ
jgi:asparagine synthase (glutamine-hydrolysing)